MGVLPSDQTSFRGYVYKIINRVNGKAYVGLTTHTTEWRWETHVLHAYGINGRKSGLQAAIRKYGRDAFSVETIDTATTVKELIDKEVAWIAELGTLRNGYNQTRGGEFPEGLPIEVNGSPFPNIKAAAASHNIAFGLVYSRLSRGWTIEQSFGLAPAPKLHKHPVAVDGREFISQSALAREYGFDHRIVWKRLKMGWTERQAVSLDPSPHVYKFEGQMFDSMNEAARAYGLPPYTPRNRIAKGWTERQAFDLDPPPDSIEIDGQHFDTLTLAAAHYSLPREVVRSRLRRGWTIRQAVGLEAAPGSIKVGGQEFKTIKDAANAFGFDYNTIRARFLANWTVEEAFELEPRERVVYGKKLQCNGVEYPSVQEMARKFGVNPGTVKSRLKIGWTPEQAVGIKQRPNRSVYNAQRVTVQGVSYSSVSAAAKAFRIDQKLVFARLKRNGWTLDEALGAVPKQNYQGPVELIIAGTPFKSMEAAAKHFNISGTAFKARLRSGWTPEQAAGLEPRNPDRVFAVADLKFPSLSGAATYYGLDPETVRKRIYAGWTPEQAVGLEKRRRQKRGAATSAARMGARVLRSSSR
jgi:hypothetical protein